MSALFQLSPSITVFPIIHGSGDFAVEVRRQMMARQFDCLAIPLPPSFQQPVEEAIHFLPSITQVVQREAIQFSLSNSPPDFSFDQHESDNDNQPDESPQASYVPIDPCQGVIAALRFAIEERLHRHFIDLETDPFECYSAVFPDPYALKQVSPERFAAALLPVIPRPTELQPRARICAMAGSLRHLQQHYKSIFFVCSITDWPWIKEAFDEQTPIPPDAPGVVDQDDIELPEIYSPNPKQLLFTLGELPYITSLYERARSELELDDNLSIDGIKAMLLSARQHYQAELGTRARKVSPKLLATLLRYVRNLTLIDRRLTPSFYTLVVAAKQVLGDEFAIALAETAREYPYTQRVPFPTIQLGIEEARLPNGDTLAMKCRLPGPVVQWGQVELRPKPPKQQQDEWELSWNPHAQCSWPQEDVVIENFRTHIKDAAMALLGNDLARSEKFSASLKDGLDIRETLRNWHTGDLYVKVLPPSKGKLDCVVMLFDSPADPRDYPWRVTWHAEHHDESTLSLFATDYQKNMVGPGIGLAVYGGAMFLFPPRPTPDIWRDPRFDLTDTLEERLLAAACFHARERHIAILSIAPPGTAWKLLARKYKKKLVHIPLARFSQEKIQQLRHFHVLNGTQVRTYAANFIRKG
jgi:hypothetical protein